MGRRLTPSVGRLTLLHAIGGVRLQDAVVVRQTGSVVCCELRCTCMWSNPTDTNCKCESVTGMAIDLPHGCFRS